MVAHRDARLLRGAATLFAAAVLVHNGDHLRRGGGSVPSDVFVIGTVGMALEIAVVMLVLMDHRLGPLVAAAAGGSLAVGYVLVHLTPQRPWLSDSLSTGDGVAWFSWAAVLGLVVASLVLAVAAAWSVFNARGGLASSTQQARTPGSLLHPVTTAVTVGNLVILAGSIATR